MVDRCRRANVVRQIIAGCAAGLLLATGSATAGNAAHAPGDPRITRVGAAPDGYSISDPSVLVTRSGVMLVAWLQYLDTPNLIKLVRKAPGGAFNAIPIPRGGLVAFGDAYLTEDTVNDRILLTAEGHGETLDDLGLYVWTSRNNGSTWSQPKRVWDSFASGQIAMDRKGGFWAITDQTWAVVAHVPASLDIQHWPDDHIVLSQRFASRGAIDVATTGAMRRLLFAWGDGNNDAWIHVGTAEDQADDVRVMRGLYADGAVQMAGVGFGAVLGGIREISTPQGNWNRLFAVGIVALKDSTEHYRPDLVSGLGEDVVSFSITPELTRDGKPTGLFIMVWLDSNERLRMSHSTRRGIPTWSPPRTILDFSTQGFSFPSAPDVADGWIALAAYSSSLREVEIVLPLR